MTAMMSLREARGVDCFGWYRGIVIGAPDSLNRVEVRVPGIGGDNSLGQAWPFDARDVVEKGEGVWVFFEQGDTRKPIWAGRWRVT